MKYAFLKVGKSSIVGKDTVLDLILRCIDTSSRINDILISTNNVPDKKVQEETRIKVENMSEEVMRYTKRIEEFISLKDIRNLPD